ncbi:aspartate/glutamate racemase family protein [Chitinophaga sp. 22536]|uniref:aspartate/glutamate racemase family protein n=1 Tax=unclassified Chitinophaga TaxID=2619133 RepID=UPI003F86B182
MNSTMVRISKVIGIVGGMGPQAGCALFSHVLRCTSAGKDQEHLPVILMSFPGDIGDRSAFLAGQVKINPAYSIAEVVQKLENAGAMVIGLACNTAHAPRIYDVIREELRKAGSRATLVHMPLETCRYLKAYHPHIRRIGLMATTGTYRSGIYQELLQKHGYEPIVPAPAFQENVIHRMIYDPVFGVKSNSGNIKAPARELMEEAVGFFEENRADAVILGCTELPLILTAGTVRNMRIIDPAEILATALVKEARNQAATAQEHCKFYYDVKNTCNSNGHTGSGTNGPLPQE